MSLTNKSRLKPGPLRKSYLKRKPAKKSTDVLPKTKDGKVDKRFKYLNPEQRQRKALDKLAGDWFRASGECFARGGFACSGPLQWCHIVRRGCRLIRHSPLNAVCMCAAHHVYYTHRPEEWRHFIEGKFPGRWDALFALDREKQSMPIVEAYQEYRGFYEGRTDNWIDWLSEGDRGSR